MASGVANDRQVRKPPKPAAPERRLSRWLGGVLRAGRFGYHIGRRVLSYLPPVAAALPRRRCRVSPESGVPGGFHGALEAVRLLAADYEARAYPESTDADIGRKIERYQALSGPDRINRVAAYRELARLEEKREDDLLGCMYRLRAMRLVGYDPYHDLDRVSPALRALGFSAEAAAAEAMFGRPDEAPERCHRLLREADARNRPAPPPVDFEAIDDRRGDTPIRVSVIVSLYRAAAKLPTFLAELQCQTLLRKGHAEVVFVDSGSPDDEYGALTRTELGLPFPYLYVRTRRRETIQTAWNRGVALARAPYLSFLGADEAVTPPALETLAACLDADPALDWVQADSIVTDVDRRGVFVRDVMPYDRAGYTPLHPYLETCYLSWVGALYRRSIHDRFGYYDGSFGAAGDTEFKNRVLPHVKTRHLPQMLGVFLNYPEERATASPRAEIEDLRAWYLHRTAGGVRYAFDGRDPAEVESLLLDALQYRKSFRRHFSTDVGYARALADYLARRSPSSPVLCLHRGVADLDDAYVTLDRTRTRGVVGLAKVLRRARQAVLRVQDDHRSTPWLRSAAYETHNDNRREQHAGIWR